MAFKDPAFVVGYGPSKYGKTTDLLYSFPNAFFIAAPGALKPSEYVVGFSIPDAHVYDARNIPDAAKKIAEVANIPCVSCGKANVQVRALCKTCGGTGKRFSAVGVDDFSLLAERSASDLEKFDPGDPKATPPRPPRPALTGFKFWGALRDEVLDFRDAARRAGLHVVMNCHEVGPSLKNGTAVRGGPKLPGRLPEELPAACDLVVRATIQQSNPALGVPDKLGWKGVYRCSPQDTGFISGDRHGVTPDYAPMNLGEILRAAGYALGRAPGLEWMEDAVAKIATALLTSGQPEKAVLTEAAQWITGPNTPIPPAAQERYTTPEAVKSNLIGLHIRWLLRDALDRAIIQRSRMNPLNVFGI